MNFERQCALSIVVPVFNEIGSLRQLHDEILTVLRTRPQTTWEVIYVDDGSTDGSLDVLLRFAEINENVAILTLRRNFGQTTAMSVGFEVSSGRVVVPLDADGQNDPSDIWKLVDALDPDIACVSGWRRQRQDRGVDRRFPSAIANGLLRKATGLNLHDFGCTIKAYNGDLLRSLSLRGDMHRVLPFYVHLAGGNVSELPVEHRPRRYGSSKYGLGRTLRVLQDAIVVWFHSSYSGRPMHLLGNIGILVILLGLVSGLLAIGLRLIGEQDFVETPLPILTALLILGGIQLFGIGLINESITHAVANTPGISEIKIKHKYNLGSGSTQLRLPRQE